MSHTYNLRCISASTFIGAFVLDSRWGLAQGFEQHDDDLDPREGAQLEGSAAQRPEGEVIDAFLGLPRFDVIQGTDLVPFLVPLDGRAERFAYTKTCFPRFRYGWAPLESIRGPRYKYIQAPKPDLYDLVEDPGERNNLHASRPEIVQI